MIIEKLKIEDIEDVLKLHNELVPFETPFEECVKTYKEMLNNEDYFLAVAKEDNKILGTATGICCHSLTAPFLVIEDVIVSEESRGKHVGKKIMAFLDEFAKSKNCIYSILISSDFRKDAHKFYENVGFNDKVRGFRKVYSK